MEARPKAWDEDQPCAKCGAVVEPARRCYAVPTCYACLPPPAPLPIVDTRRYTRGRMATIVQTPRDVRCGCASKRRRIQKKLGKRHHVFHHRDLMRVRVYELHPKPCGECLPCIHGGAACDGRSIYEDDYDRRHPALDQ